MFTIFGSEIYKRVMAGIHAKIQEGQKAYDQHCTDAHAARDAQIEAAHSICEDSKKAKADEIVKAILG